MAVYKPYIKKSNGTIDELPLYATTAGEVMNLGYYDTITENSDGTYTITRQTGYLTINAEDITKGSNETVNSAHAYVYAYNNNVSNALYYWDAIIGISNNGFEVKCVDSEWTGANKISINSTGNQICIGFSSPKTQAEIQALCPIYVQYKLATATTEKVEKNHYARYNEKFILEHNKSEAEKSANLLNTFDRSNIPTDSSLYRATLNRDGSYTGSDDINSDRRSWAYVNSDFKLHLTKGTYTFSVTGTISTNEYTQMELFDSNNNLLCGLYRPNNFKNSFALTSDADIGILIKSYNSKNLKIMLNEGTEPLPYQPYKGKIVHENDLKNVSTSLGYYDEVTENIDGTYTITRQTGYHNISIDLIKNGTHRPTQGGHGEYGSDTGIHNLPIVSGSKNFINNLLPVRDTGEIYSGSIGIAITREGGCWVNLGDNYTTTEQYREYFAKNNIYVQYKLATATTEKVEKNHYAVYNQSFILEHNKTEAERSANLLNPSWINSEYAIYNPSDNSYYLSASSYGKIYDNLDSKITNKGHYVLSFMIKAEESGKEPYIVVRYIDTDGNIAWKTTKDVTTTNYIECKLDFYGIPKEIYLTYANISSAAVIKDIMLNEGSIPLPYQPYVGRIIHKKDLENLPKLYNHFLIITFTHSSRTYKCKVNILSSVSTKITNIDNLASVCRGAINIYETNSDNNYYWSMPAEGALNSNETSTSQNYVIFRLFIYYDYNPSGQKLVYAYYINQTDNGSNFGIANSYSGQYFSDTVKTIYGGK